MAQQKERREGEQLWLWGGEGGSNGVLCSCEEEERSEGGRKVGRERSERGGKLCRRNKNNVAGRGKS